MPLPRCRAMAANILFFVAGMLLAAMTLRDVFQTVIVPGGSQSSLSVAHRLVFILLPLWKWARGRRRALSATFAPLLLVLSFVIWVLLLALGFGLAAWALRSQFQPPLRQFGDAFYTVGGSLTTIGSYSSTPLGYARWVVLGAGFCGLAVITMAVTYLLMIQGSIASRDVGIMKLDSSAGSPPSALGLLQTLASLRSQSSLDEILRQARDWCVTVRQSHGSHPSLLYFQSVGTGAGWPATLGALLDLALFETLLIDDPARYGAAVLLGQDGVRMARELAELVQIDPASEEERQVELEEVALVLSRSGYDVRAGIDFEDVARRRSEAQVWVNALADHLGKPRTPLVGSSADLG